MDKKDSINIYDIANLASVSIATVSRVLNNSAKVSGKTREKVLRVIQEAGFSPNSFARGLGLGSMRMVGILCTDVSDMFYAAAVAAIEKILRENSFNALLCCTGNRLDDKKDAIGLLLSKNVDAIILIGSAFREQSDNSHIEHAARHVPVIIINGLVELPSTYCVLCDENEAMFQNVMYLYKQGRRNVLYIYDVNTFSGSQKLAGYRRAHEQLGIPVCESKILRTDKDISTAANLVERLFASGENIDAILASEDILAIGALKAAEKLEIKLPVIGFNNSVLADCSTPSLTSVDNMIEPLCAMAVNVLLDLLDGKAPPAKIQITARLVQRDSFKIKGE